MEEWRQVVGGSGEEVSNLGNVRGRDGMIVKLKLRQGYLYANGRPVHRLVLHAFVGPCPVGLEVCHNDGNPQNNALENLRYDTHSNNMRDMRRHGTAGRGEGNKRTRMLSAMDVMEIRQRHADGESVRSLVKQYGVSKSTISRVVLGKVYKEMDGPITRMIGVYERATKKKNLAKWVVDTYEEARGEVDAQLLKSLIDTALDVARARGG